MPELIGNPLKVVDSRYFVEGAETKWSELAIRVGSSIAMAESSETNRKKYSDIFTESIFNLEFIPGGRILRNAGRIKGSLFNCYVLPFGDSREEIGKYYSDSFVLWGEGGGIGTNLSSLRPEGAPIRGVGGKSSGPISFLKASDFIAETIQIGGQRRAAGLALMNVRHPDILKFINAKLVDKLIPHYNISVGVTEEFLQRVESNKMWDLKFAQKTYNTIDAKTLWDTLISNMLTSAEPGLINWDNLRENNSYFYAPVITTNPSLRKGTKLLTDNGIIPIEELQDKNFKIPNIKNAYSNATCFLSGVNKNLYKITLQGGHEIFATAEHKWPTVIKNKWNYELNDFIKKKTNKLNKGDYLPQPVKKTELGYGDKGSYNDGFLIGWNIGDGWISNNDRKEQIGFIVAKEDQKYDIHNILTKKLKELGWTGEFKNRNNNKETNISNNAVRKFFQNFGVTKKNLVYQNQYGILLVKILERGL